MVKKGLRETPFFHPRPPGERVGGEGELPILSFLCKGRFGMDLYSPSSYIFTPTLILPHQGEEIEKESLLPQEEKKMWERKRKGIRSVS